MKLFFLLFVCCLRDISIIPTGNGFKRIVNPILVNQINISFQSSYEVGVDWELNLESFLSFLFPFSHFLFIIPNKLVSRSETAQFKSNLTTFYSWIRKCEVCLSNCWITYLYVNLKIFQLAGILLILSRIFFISLPAWFIGYDISSDWCVFAGTSSASG